MVTTRDGGAPGTQEIEPRDAAQHLMMHGPFSPQLPSPESRQYESRDTLSGFRLVTQVLGRDSGDGVHISLQPLKLLAI